MNPYLQHLKYVKDRADIVEIISHFVKLKRNGSGYEGKSPFSDERTASFTVAPSKRFFKCFSSGKQGDVIDFVMHVKSLTQKEAVQWISDYYNIAKPEPEYIYIPPKELPTSFISHELFWQTINTGHKNYFIDFLRKKIGVMSAFGCIEKYKIGTSKYWPGATIFWQVDVNNKIRSGKIMVYNPETGKRIKDPKPLITWVHKAAKMVNFNLESCLFGEHLIANWPLESWIGLVESEKTAIIASVYDPDKLWIATGSLTNLSHKRCKCLEGRKIQLFPDVGAEDRWEDKMNELKELIPGKWMLSKLPDTCPKGFDLCDYILENNLI